MKSPLTILFAGAEMPHAFDAAFGGKSAFDRALSWAEHVPGSVRTVVFTAGPTHALVEKAAAGKNVLLVRNNSWTSGMVAREVAAACKDCGADFAVYVWADCPFLSEKLTAELIETHVKYLAEYTFSDGYPYGLSPEIIDGGAAGILAALAGDIQKSAGEKPAGRDALFSIMSGDVNSFEIETVIAPKDYRLLRLDFSCGDKINFLACRSLYEASREKLSLDSADFNPVALSDCAESSLCALQTVPAFYGVQISARYNHVLPYAPCAALSEKHASGDMPFEAFRKIVSEMAALSGKAVVSLSAFGEPLLHPQFVDFVKEVLSHPGLSVLIETDGTLVTPELVDALASLEHSRITWIVLLDAMESKLYAELHQCGEADFEKAVNAVGLLSARFPHQVYPQMTRMKANEAQLEPFYRYWKNKDNASAGEVIVQKYNSFCGALPDEKPADLSPLVRIPCWHLRRDMTILADGTVPFCLSGVLDSPAGNAVQDGIETVWARFKEPLAAHLTKDYTQNCKACDEYYTFNF